MSTDGKRKTKQKRGLLHIERIKIIEYGSIALVILLFLGLAILYGGKGKQKTEPDAEPTAAPTPVPTEDTAIRSRRVFDALEGAGYTVTPSEHQYEVLTPEGVALTMRIDSDDSGIAELTFETYLAAEPEGDSYTAQLLRDQDTQTLQAVRTMFDLVLPIFQRTAKDSDTIVAQSRKVANSGTPYSARFGKYTLRIESDPTAIPQTVIIRLIRN